jgi:ectoine hydroxylase-related dioxygenase (phytanoyl-CoA dioxygenase family)
MIFREAQLNEQLATQGYVVIPFLEEAQVQQLRECYNRYKGNSAYFHSTTFFPELETKKKASAEINEVFSAKVAEMFDGYQRLGASFLCKPTGAGGNMPVHQDWTVVDESQFGSYTIWVPLQDVDENNGTITVLDGSHKLTSTLRGPTLPVVIKDIEPLIKANMKTLRMKSGEAFIFNHALIHASHLNVSGVDRLAVTLGLIPERAQLLFYHRNEKNEIEKYEVDNEFFMQYNNIGQKPEFVEPKCIVQEKFEPISAGEFDKFLRDYKMKIMKPLFKDPKLQEQFNKDGYLLVDLLSEAEVADLKAYYETLNNQNIPAYGFHVSLDNNDADFVTRVMDKIKSVMRPHADEIFNDYKIFTSSYVVKEKNPIGIVPPHQDWTFVDEEAGYYSATVWTALVDTDMYNGAMGVISGSHKFFDHYRASPAPQFKTPLDLHVFSIFPYLKLLPMKAGQALIFDNALIHASPPNVSDGVRLAVGFGVTQKDAPQIHYQMQPESGGKKLEKYEVDNYFFTHFNNGKLSTLYNEGKHPEGLKMTGLVANTVKDISADDLLKMIKAEGNTFNVEMCEHLAKLFNYNLDGSKKEEAKPENQPSPEPAAEPVLNTTNGSNESNAWVDDRPFFQKYTPLNIIREVKKRVFAN